MDAPDGDAVDLVALAVEDLEEFGVAVGEGRLLLGRQTVLVRVEEALELLELELRMRHALTDDLTFLREREDVDVELGDHDLHAERGVRVDGGFDVFVLWIVEAPLALDADPVDADAGV